MLQDIMIVEDHPLVAEATKALLGGAAGVGRIATFVTADQAKAELAAEDFTWSLILLDLDVPGALGFSLATHIHALGRARITCILTGNLNEAFVRKAQNEGFLGYILKASHTEQLVESLGKVLQGERVFPTPGPAPAASRTVVLTPRQREVLHGVSRGLTSKEIARDLNLTPGTVDNHINAAIAALSARTRSEAVSKALMLSIIRA